MIRHFAFFGLLIASSLSLASEIHVPPPGPVRTPAEWEPTRKVMLAWPDYLYASKPLDYENFKNILKNTILALRGNCQIIVISDFPPDMLAEELEPELSYREIIQFRNFANPVWIRDYGPQSVFYGPYQELGLVDWMYSGADHPMNHFVKFFGEFVNLDVYSTQDIPWSFANVGGNFLTDGFGKAFALESILRSNPSNGIQRVHNILNKFNGIEKLFVLATPKKKDFAHIDMHMKMVDEETWLVNTYPQSHPLLGGYTEDLVAEMSNYKSVYHRNFRFVYVPCDIDMNANPYLHPDGCAKPYTNFTFVNRTILLPSYALHKDGKDAKAREIVAGLCDGYQIKQIDCNASYTLSGAIHCLTNQVAAPFVAHIKHARLFDKYIEPAKGQSGIIDYMEYEDQHGYPVIANVESSTPPIGVYLHYSENKGSFRRVTMQKNASGEYTARIPSCLSGTVIDYHIEVQTRKGIIQKPPYGHYQFRIIPSDPCERERGFAGGQQRPLDFTGSQGLTHVSSNQSISIPPETTLASGVAFLEAPRVGYSQAPGTWDWLNLYDSQLSVRATDLYLPKLRIGNSAKPDGTADHSSASFQSCNETQYERLELASDGEVTFRAEQALVLGSNDVPSTGDPLQASVSYESYCRVKFISKNLTINRPIVMAATLPNLINTTGYLKFLAPNGSIYIVPPELNTLDLSVWNNWLLNTSESVISHSKLTLQANASLTIRANQSTKIEGTTIELSDVIQEPTTVLDIQTAEFNSLASKFFGGPVTTAWRGPVSGQNVSIKVCYADAPQPQMKAKTTVVQTEAVAPAGELTIRASSLDLGDIEIETHANSSAEIAAGNIVFSSDQRLVTDRSNSRITIRALSEQQVASHEKELACLSSVAVAKNDPGVAATLASIETSIDESRPMSSKDSLAAERFETDYEFAMKNYPNPFNPTTTVKIQLPRSGQVTIDIFDILGKRVVSLHEGSLNRGVHHFEWNATDHASGTYFSVVQGVDENGQRFKKVHKMLLIK